MIHILSSSCSMRGAAHVGQRSPDVYLDRVACLSERRVISADAKPKSGELLDGQRPNAEGDGAKEIRACSSWSCARGAHACARERHEGEHPWSDAVPMRSGCLLPMHLVLPLCREGFTARLFQCAWHAARAARAIVITELRRPWGGRSPHLSARSNNTCSPCYASLMRSGGHATLGMLTIGA
jgi:hypothetical protein